MISKRDKEVIDTSNIITNNCATMLVGKSNRSHLCCNSARNMGRTNDRRENQLMAPDAYSTISVVKS
jgi:hypothetical protein